MQNNKKTILGVFAEKLTDHVAAHRVGQLARQAAELTAGLILGALVVAPDPIINFLSETLKSSNFAVPKFATVMILFYCRKTIVRVIRTVARQSTVNKAIKAEEKLIDNIPTAELVDYLIRNKHFKREGANGVRATFGLNMEKFNALAAKLEKNGVLVRGENNGRILAPTWSRQSLFDYLAGKEKSADLAPRFKICRIGAGAKIRLDKPEIARVN